jgi:hypothetical protein
MKPNLKHLIVFAIVAMPLASIQARTLSLDERVEAQRAIEQVYWSHRLWPKDNPGSKPQLTAVMSDDAVRRRVQDYLRESRALELRQRPITAVELQTELDRIAANTQDPETLRELFHALGDDPFVIAETLVRQTLADRLIQTWFEPGWGVARVVAQAAVESPQAIYALPDLPATTCTEDAWSATRLDGTTPAARFDHTAVWTGTEVIVWGGWTGASGSQLNTGGRYVPATDTWSATSVGANVASARRFHTAVWTGTEMIVWGGFDGAALNTGGRYSPTTNTWTATPTGGETPAPRNSHTAVWTGTEMIVWGGHGTGYLNSGGRYAPSTNSWAATSVATTPPTGRADHTAVWSGNEMIVWGGDTGADFVQTGGRYNPSTNIWTGVSTGVNVPPARVGHTAVWTGTEMIAWGGVDKDGFPLDSGGRYNPTTNSWLPTSTGAGLPLARSRHAAVWTGTQMIVWGGGTAGGDFNTGARYTPASDTWLQTPTSAGVPAARSHHTATWTGNQIIVWGGSPTTASGGRYCVQSCATPTSWYQDNDGDGFGVESTAVPACAQPAGYVASAGECNDANPAIHPGAAEACNGLDDDCDNVVDDGAAPAEASNNLRVSRSGTSAMISWTLAAGATTSDLLRGFLSTLPVGPGGGDEVCLNPDTMALAVTDGSPGPGVGQGFWYVVRGGNACGNGPYGFQEQNGVPTVPRVSTTCP